MKNEPGVYAFLDFLLSRESAEALTLASHQASTNRLLNDSGLDPRLKPSFLREVPLSQIHFLKDFGRAPEVRALIGNPTR